MNYFLIFIFFSFSLHSTVISLKQKHTMHLEQKFPRIGGSCAISTGDATYLGLVTNLTEESCTVKKADLNLHPSLWPLVTFPPDEVSPHPDLSASSLLDLKNNLCTASILVTPCIRDAFLSIDRAWFTPHNPYSYYAVDLGHGMCVSSPLMHVLALELLKTYFPSSQSILDAGSGSGIMCAYFSQLTNATIDGIEAIPELAVNSRETISRNLPQAPISVEQGNALAPSRKYDIIHVGFMCPTMPQSLLDALKPGGAMVIPVGNKRNEFHHETVREGILYLVEKNLDGVISKYPIIGVVFVPSVY